MRTVAFSEPETVKALNDQFVCSWVNRRPDLKFKDGLYPATWKPRNLPEGAGVTNVTSVFANADGTILHAIPGYLSPASFRRHLDFALRIDFVLRLGGVLEAAGLQSRSELYAEAHKNAAKAARNYIEQGAHAMLAPKLLRVGEMKFEFFDDLGDVFR